MELLKHLLQEVVLGGPRQADWLMRGAAGKTV